MKSRSATRALSAASRASTRPPCIVGARHESSSSATASSSSWQPVVPSGQIPAYDAALAFLNEYKSTTLSEVERLRSLPSTPETSSRIRYLEVRSLVNDPATRRLFRETAGKGMMDQPVMRHLAQKRWEKEGGLDRLMQRVEQMGVVPDLVGGIRGSAPITFSTGEGEVEPGSFQAPSSFNRPPSLHVQLLDDAAGEALYTLLVLDADSPNYQTQSYGQRLQYYKSDIPLTVASGEQDLFASNIGKEVLGWEAPLPPRGSGVHRYVFLLLRQSASPSTPSSRDDIDIRTLVEQGSEIVALTLFRSKWSKEENEYIERTHQEIHGVEVPVYEKPPKELRYGMPLSKKSMERERIREEAWEEALGEIVGENGEVKIERA
jgi:large subunit ribosomal protein L35